MWHIPKINPPPKKKIHLGVICVSTNKVEQENNVPIHIMENIINLIKPISFQN